MGNYRVKRMHDYGRTRKYKPAQQSFQSKPGVEILGGPA